MGFFGTCCNWCCLLTGGFGVVFLSILGVLLLTHAYFEPEDLVKTKDELKEEKNLLAYGHFVGAGVELIVFLASLIAIIVKRKAAKKARIQE